MTMMAGVEQRRDGNNTNWVSPGQARHETALSPSLSLSLSHTHTHTQFHSTVRSAQSLVVVIFLKPA